MTTEPKKISIDTASIIDLKAELLKKQEEYKLKKLEKSKQNEYEIKSSTIKKAQIWDKKKKEKSNEKITVESIASEKKENEISIEENDLLNKSKRILESKAKFYEDLVKGSVAPEEGDEEIFLVDFDKKAYEIRKETEEDDDEHIKFTEGKKYAAVGFSYDGGKKVRVVKEESTDKKFGVKSSVNEDEYRELLRNKWEEDRIKNLEKTDIHYGDIKYDEARELGVGHFKFSTREEQRKKQMAFFDELKAETTSSRINAQIEKKSRAELLKERIRKVRQKRLLKEGYKLEDIDSIFKAEDEAEAMLLANQAKELEEEEAKEREEEAKMEERKKSLPVLKREWDKPKLKEPIWNKIVENIRQERHSEFAPPKSYENKKKSKKKKLNKPKDEVKFKEMKMTEANTFEETNTITMMPPPFIIPPPIFIPPPVPFMFNPSIPPPVNFAIPPPVLPFNLISTQKNAADIPIPSEPEPNTSENAIIK